MAGPLLRTGHPSAFHPVGAVGNPVYLAASQLRSAMMRRLGPEVADAFAIPQRNESGDTIDWYAPQAGTVVPWSAASPEERANAKDQLLAIRERVDELAREMAAATHSERQAFGRLLEQVTVFPDEEHVYLVDDRPVLTFWGFYKNEAVVGSDPLLELEPLAAQDGRRRGLPWWLWLLPLLLLLAAAAVFLSMRGCATQPEGPVDTTEPVGPAESDTSEPEQPALDDLAEESYPEDRSDELSTEDDTAYEPVREDVHRYRSAVERERRSIDAGDSVEVDRTALGDTETTLDGTDELLEADDLADAEGLEGDPADPAALGNDEATDADLAEDELADGDAIVDEAADGEPLAEDPGAAPDEAMEPDDEPAEPEKPIAEDQAGDESPAEEQPESPPDTDAATDSAEPPDPSPGPPSASDPSQPGQGAISPARAKRLLELDWRPPYNLQDERGRPLEMSLDGDEIRLRRGDGELCTSKVTRRVEGGQMKIEGQGRIRCKDGTELGRAHFDCTPGAGDTSRCRGGFKEADSFEIELQGHE